MPQPPITKFSKKNEAEGETRVWQQRGPMGGSDPRAHNPHAQTQAQAQQLTNRRVRRHASCACATRVSCMLQIFARSRACLLCGDTFLAASANVAQPLAFTPQTQRQMQWSSGGEFP